MMTWRFIRVNAVRIVIGMVLLAAVYFAISIYATYQREQRIARTIESVSGVVVWDYCGPIWIPKTIRDRLPLCRRIISARMNKPTPTDVISELGTLRNLVHLDLRFTQVDDAGMKYLNGLLRLKELDISHTKVTDTGLEHLKGLTNLTRLSVGNTTIPNADLENLRCLTNLKSLNLAHTSLNNDRVELSLGAETIPVKGA